MYRFDRETYERRMAWFRQARFGLFVHFGLYALPARGEWVRSVERMDEAAYRPYFEQFEAREYDPRAWARAAKAAGMGYAVLTAKHHDGFCLFDSALTDYKSTNTPCGRDLVREFLDAFRAEGLRVGLYYSLLDWHHPDYPHYGDWHHPLRDDPSAGNDSRDFGRYLDYMHGQVRELCTHYGKLDLMWFDFSYGEMTGAKWRAAELADMVRSLQPGIILDNRLEASGEGFGSLYECAPTPWHGDFVTVVFPDASFALKIRNHRDDAGNGLHDLYNLVLRAVNSGDKLVVGCKLARKIVGGVVGHYLSLVYNDYPVADRLHLAENVRRKNDGVILAQLFDKGSYLDYLLGVEAYGGLVENEHVGVADKRLRQADALSVSL